MKKITGAAPNHFKLRGELVELRFMTCATEHGLRVSKPWGESSRYDFVVETGGRFLRVQVKSTTCLRGSNYICSTVGANQKAYNRAEIDFFAIYIIPVDAWYIVPIAFVRDKKRGLCFTPHNSHSKHAPYKEAWHLLQVENRENSETPQSIAECREEVTEKQESR
jgi:hypothetical protein